VRTLRILPHYSLTRQLEKLEHKSGTSLTKPKSSSSSSDLLDSFLLLCQALPSGNGKVGSRSSSSRRTYFDLPGLIGGQQQRLQQQAGKMENVNLFLLLLLFLPFLSSFLRWPSLKTLPATPKTLYGRGPERCSHFGVGMDARRGENFVCQPGAQREILLAKSLRKGQGEMKMMEKCLPDRSLIGFFVIVCFSNWAIIDFGEIVPPAEL
jgi:hypothetical protein